MGPVVDLWSLLESARAEAKELDVAICALVNDHSSMSGGWHGELLRDEYKRLVELWKEKERQFTKLNRSLINTALQQASL